MEEHFKIISNYFVHVNEKQNLKLDITGDFLGRRMLAQLTPVEIQNLNRTVSTEGIKTEKQQH